MEEPVFRKPTRSLRGKVAIVTGAGAAGEGIGNGRASAILFAEEGCKVVCVDRDLSSAQRTVDMIQSGTFSSSPASSSSDLDTAKTENQDQSQGEALALQADVSVEPDCQRVVEETIRHYGRVDILLNCVGVGGAPGTAVDCDMDAFRRDFDVNVFSMVQMAKYAIPEMTKNDPAPGWRGSIVNMASVAGIRGGTPHLFYPTSKGTIVNMTRAMAFHHAPELIRVNCVCPGMVYTPMMYATGRMTASSREARKNRSLLKTEGNAWDVAGAVRFLAGDEARWITGIELPVDAGATCAVLGADIPRSASVNG